uniref:Uncharacterized protein n=1 Tax=Globodera rostochiensis TaxID=31243 RepID=A0A914GZM4_GLORO
MAAGVGPTWIHALHQIIANYGGKRRRIGQIDGGKGEKSRAKRARTRKTAHRLSEVELGLLRVEDEKRELQHRIKELDHSLKQSNELNGRLENKHYYEERVNPKRERTEYEWIWIQTEHRLNIEIVALSL